MITDLGDASSALQPCRANLGESTRVAAQSCERNSSKSGSSRLDGIINPLKFLQGDSNGMSPSITNWFHYEDSLTSEPYSEDVRWFVMKNESKIAPKNLKERKEYAEQKACPPYELNRRIVVWSF